VALRLASVLGVDGLLIGGMAVGAHGYVRATRDVDFVTSIPLPEIRTRLSHHGITATLERGEFSCLRGTLDGVSFDVLPPLVPLDWDQAIEVPMGGNARLRVVDLDGLIRLKLLAQGPKDLMDVAALVLRHPDRLKATREIATAYGALDRLDLWLKDPRLQAEIREARKAEEAQQKPGSARPGRSPRARRRK
jgi:hypothetical protein